MVEYLREILGECKVEIDTNKMTYRKTFHLEKEESVEEFLQRVKEWTLNTLEGIE